MVGPVLPGVPGVSTVKTDIPKIPSIGRKRKSKHGIATPGKKQRKSQGRLEMIILIQNYLIECSVVYFSCLILLTAYKVSLFSLHSL
jgi:hypothetical protein